MKNFVVSFGTYPFEVEVFVGDAESFRVHLTEQEVDKEEIETALHDVEGDEALTLEFSGGIYYLWIHHYENSAHCNSIIAHECFHLVEMSFDKIGIKHHIKYSSEAYAYQLGFLFESIVAKLME